MRVRLEHRLAEIGVAHVAGQERHARRSGLTGVAEQFAHSVRAQRELPVAGRRLDAELTHHGGHIAASRLQRRVGALQRVATVQQQQHALGSRARPAPPLTTVAMRSMPPTRPYVRASAS